MIKTCLSCGNKLSGRTDKKFCNNSCKNDYHNTIHPNGNGVEKMVSAAIRRNRKILQNLFDDGLCKLEKTDLEHFGFSFKGLTGIEEMEKGMMKYFCYEFTISRKGKMFELRKSS